MFKKSPSRNQRSKGFKIKHVLQICLLLGVCFWLIYQVKRSYDKRKEFDEKDVKASVKSQSDDVILKFGRKGLPYVQDVSKNYKNKSEEEEEDGVENKNKHDEEREEKGKRLEEDKQEGSSKHEEDRQEEVIKHKEAEQEEVWEDEGSKHDVKEQGASEHEEDEQEEVIKHEEAEQEEVWEDKGSKHDDDEQVAESKNEEAEDDGRGDDEVDENELEKIDGEGDREEKFLDEEETEAEGDDKGNDEKDNEEKEGQEESFNLVNNQNHNEGGRSAHEVREEQYKADDASSAVAHDTQSINSEVDKLDMENYNDNSKMSVSEHKNKANITQETNGDKIKQELKVDEGKHSESGRSLNVTYTKENDHETGSSNSVYILLPSTTKTTDFIDQASNTSLEVSEETGNSPAEVNTEKPGSLQKETSAQNKTEDGMVTEEKYEEKANEMISINKQPDSSTADSSKIENVALTNSSNSSSNAEFGMSEDIAKVNGTAEGDSFGSSMTKEVTDSTQTEKSVGDNESVGTDESSDNSSSKETIDGGQPDPIDSFDNTLPQDEKDARVDLSTLPDITTEESNNEDAAAE